MSVDFNWGADLEDLRVEAQDFARMWVAEHGGFEDCWMTGHSPELAIAVARRGWIGMLWPRELGGGGQGPLERFVVLEALMEHGVPMADWWFADQLIGPVLVRHGRPEQQARWLPDILAGRARWTVGSAESGAGSDPTAMTTHATVDGDALVLNGTKMWVLGPADWCYVICRTDSAIAGRSGMRELVVDMSSPGLQFHPIRDASGSSDFGHLELRDVRVPMANLIGEPDTSLRLLRELDRERGGVDRLVCNRALYLLARDGADRADPLVRQRIAKLETGYRIGRALVLRGVLEPGTPGLTALVKVFCSEFEQLVAEFCVDAAGVLGLAEIRRTRALVYSRAYTLMGGTSQMLRTILGERALGLPS